MTYFANPLLVLKILTVEYLHKAEVAVPEVLVVEVVVDFPHSKEANMLVMLQVVTMMVFPRLILLN